MIFVEASIPLQIIHLEDLSSLFSSRENDDSDEHHWKIIQIELNHEFHLARVANAIATKSNQFFLYLKATSLEN